MKLIRILAIWVDKIVKALHWLDFTFDYDIQGSKFDNLDNYGFLFRPDGSSLTVVLDQSCLRMTKEQFEVD